MRSKSVTQRRPQVASASVGTACPQPGLVQRAGAGLWERLVLFYRAWAWHASALPKQKPLPAGCGRRARGPLTKHTRWRLSAGGEAGSAVGCGLTCAACARAQLTFNNTLTYYYSEDAWMGCKFFQDTVRASTAGVQDFPDARVG